MKEQELIAKTGRDCFSSKLLVKQRSFLSCNNNLHERTDQSEKKGDKNSTMQRIFDYSLLFVLGYLCRPVAPFTATSFLVKRPNSQCERSKLNLLPPDAASSAADSLLVPTPSSLVWMSHAVIAADTNAAENDTGLLSNQAIIVTFIIGLIPFVAAMTRSLLLGKTTHPSRVEDDASWERVPC